MSALYAVPDPDDEQDPGEYPAPAPSTEEFPPEGDPTDEDEEDDEDQDDEDDDQDSGDEDEAGQGETVVRRALVMPDLTPYVDVRALTELGPIAADVGRASRPLLLRAYRATKAATVRAARGFYTAQLSLLRGLWLLGQFFTRWITCEVGKGGGVGARIGCAVFAVYATFHASRGKPAAPLIVLTLVGVMAVLVGVGRITLPQPKAEEKKKDGKKDGKKADEKEPAAKKKDGKKAEEKAAEGPAGTPAESTEKEVEKAPPAKGLRGLFARRRKKPATAPAGTPAEGAGETPDEDQEQAPAEARDEAPTRAPSGPSREALIEALNHPDRGGKGVLLTTLEKSLNLPDTGAVKEVLDGAGIRWRGGVRTTTKNGPGVHPDDIPPLAPAQGVPLGSDVAAGQSANANNNNSANGPEEGLDARGTDPWIGPHSGGEYVRQPGDNPGAWMLAHLKKP